MIKHRRSSWGMDEGMSATFDSHATTLMGDALCQALDRLRMLGLVDGDERTASAALAKLILKAMERGERNEENLILYAIGRFQMSRPSEGH